MGTGVCLKYFNWLYLFELWKQPWDGFIRNRHTGNTSDSYNLFKWIKRYYSRFDIVEEIN